MRKLGHIESFVHFHITFERSRERKSYRKRKRVRRRSRERKLGLELWSKSEAKILILEGLR